MVQLNTIEANSTFKCWGLMGHSNGYGLASVNEMTVQHNHLISSQNFHWPNLFVWTDAHGYPGPDGTPPTHTIAEGKWLEMTVLVDSPHIYDSPFQVANVGVGPYTQYMQDIDVIYLGLSGSGSGAMGGLSLPLSWHASNYWQDQCGLVGLAVPSSLALRYDQGGPVQLQIDRSNYQDTPASFRPDSWVRWSPEGYYNWYTPSEQFDFQPGTNRLYESWLAKCIAARDEIEALGSKMDMDFVVCWFGDNDSPLGRRRLAYWKQYVEGMVETVRRDLVANRLTQQPAHQVKIIWMAVKQEYDEGWPSSPNGNPAFMNQIAREVAESDPWMEVIDTDGFETHSFDPSHLNHNGYVEAAASVMSAVVAMDEDPYDAMNGAKRKTVQEAFDDIRLKFTRAKVNTDVDNDVLMQALNEALFNILGEVGDSAYWLIRRHPISLSGGGTASPITLPRKVEQIVAIEAVNDTTYPVNFEEIGRHDGGKMQIVMPEQSSGEYYVRYLRNPCELSATAELVPLPQRYMNWLYAETCVLMTATANDPIQRAAFEAQATKAKRTALAKISATTRAKRKRLYTQRRLPDPMRRRRLRRWDFPS